MKEKKVKPITGLDIAKVLGLEDEYQKQKDKKIQEEIEKTKKDFLESDFVDLK
jgi:hypothetical protein